MKNKLYFLLLLIVNNFYGQINFENGYFKGNNGNETVCFIKNEDWKNNPRSFKYKVEENGEVKEALITNVTEFAITNGERYVRATVNIERSSELVGQVSDEKEFKLLPETLFLKQLVSGKANLYVFNDTNYKKFFYNLDDGEIKFLAYKSYLDENGDIYKNNKFRQDLYRDLKCDKIPSAFIETLQYRESELESFFEKYNACVTPITENTSPLKKKNEHVDWFNLTVRAGINIASPTVNFDSSSSLDLDFGTVIGPRFGAELEFIAPFKKGKWAIIVEPTYQSLKNEYDVYTSNISKKAVIDYKSVEIAIGLRHYFFLNQLSKIFLNASVVKDFAFNSFIEKPNAGQDYNTVYDIDSPINFSLGLGYKLKNKYSFEIKYYSKREITGDYKNLDSGMKNIAFILGYQIF